MASSSILAFRCDICTLSVNSKEQLVQHFSGSRHKRNEIKHTQGTGQGIKHPSDYFVPAQNEIVSQSQESNQQGIIAAAVYSDTYCHSCRVQLTSITQAEVHYKGSKHRQKLKLLEEKTTVCQDEASAAKKARVEICEVCNVKLLSPAVATPHYTGEKHRRKVALLKSIGVAVDNANTNNSDGTLQVGYPQAVNHPQGVTQPTSQGKKFHCSFCNITLNSQAQMEAHRSGSKHRSKVEKFACPPVVNNISSAMTTVACPASYPQPVYSEHQTANLTVACSASYSQPVYSQQTANFTAPGQFVSPY